MVGCVALVATAQAQDLSTYRGVRFGSSVAAVAAIPDTGGVSLKVVHRRPALIQELSWKPQSSPRSPAGTEAARDVTFRFYNDQLFSIAVTYDSRVIEGMTNQDLIDALSTIYGPPVLPSVNREPASGKPDAVSAIARWDTTEYKFMLTRDGYGSTARLVGVSKQLEAAARMAASEAVRLDTSEAPAREADRVAAEAARIREADTSTRIRNKAGFRP